MATATDKAYVATALDEIEAAPLVAPGATDDGRRRVDVRRHFGITSFGINAFSGGEMLIREHDEDGIGSSRQEELYVVLNGAATFTVDGEEVKTPAGTLVFARPEAKRSAVATEDGTTVLVIGGTPGKAFEPAPEESAEAFAAYTAGDYETAVSKQLIVVEKRPNNVFDLFNVACFEARAGRTDDALEHLRKAVEGDDRIKELIRTDEDLDSLREDPRFEVLAK